MKLITKEIEKRLAKYPHRSQEGKGGDAEIVCKFFTPDSDFTWYVLEAEKVGGDYELYGIVENVYGREYGYFMLSELESLRGPFGLLVERDLYLDAKTVKDIS